MKLGFRGMAIVLLALAPLAGCAGGSSCNALVGGSGTPSLVLTHVPPLGSTESLKGRVIHVVPAGYFVAVYIHVGSSGWWTKPTFADPETTIACDGSWTTDITTGGDDPQANAIAAFLLPEGFTPPPMGGDSTLPQALYASAVANVSVTR